MAKVASKGSKIQMTIATVLTDIPDVTEFRTSGTDVTEFDSTTLNQSTSGREYDPDGYAEGGNVTGKKFFDPVNAVDQAMTDLITTPAKVACKVIWSDAASTEWPFTGILKKFDVAAAMNNGLMADFDWKLSGLFTYPT